MDPRYIVAHGGYHLLLVNAFQNLESTVNLYHTTLLFVGVVSQTHDLIMYTATVNLYGSVKVNKS